MVDSDRWTTWWTTADDPVDDETTRWRDVVAALERTATPPSPAPPRRRRSQRRDASSRRSWRHPARARRLRRAPDPPGLRAVRQDPRPRRPGHPPRRAGRARPGARRLPIERPGGHRHRPGRSGPAPAPRRRHLPHGPTASGAGRQRDVAARGLHRSQRRHADRRREPSLDRRATRTDTAPTTTVEMPAGTALVYLGSVWHGGGANPTDHGPAGRRPALRVGVAPAGGEPRRWRCRPTWRGRCRRVCRSCSATTSTRPSSGTSTAATPASC